MPNAAPFTKDVGCNLRNGLWPIHAIATRSKPVCSSVGDVYYRADADNHNSYQQKRDIAVVTFHPVSRSALEIVIR